MPETIYAENLLELSSVRHGFFTRGWGHCGLSDNFDPTKSVINRGKVAEHLSIAPLDLLSCYQVHSPDVVNVTKAWNVADRPKADAMVTTERGIALGILTADCVPLLFADAGAGVIGGAHAGWRGAVMGVIENTLAAMEQLGANRRATRVALGPCVWQNSYEVGPEFPALFVAEDPDHKRFFRPAFRRDHYLFDLPGYVVARLRAAGVTSIEPSPGDTLADEDRFFSYRRNFLKGIAPTESLISVIALATV